MKLQTLYSRLLLLLAPFLFTGCYTQFQTFDQYPRYERSYSSNDDQNRVADPEAEALEMELALEEMGIYFQDYETKRWYMEHYADKLFWEGYDEGYDDGYFDGWANTGYFPYSARYSMNRHRFLRGYTGAFAYYDFYHYPGFYSSFWINFSPYHYGGFYAGYYNNWGYYSPYYYNNYWGYGHYNYHFAYNNYYRNKKYRRDADLYRKGPRNTGLVNRGEYRTRGSSGLNRDKNTGIRTRSTGVTRTRSVNTGSRVRGSGSSSVGKSRSSGSSTRSRGSGSSVGKRSSDGNSGKSRSRGNDSYSSNFGQTSVRDINVSELRSRTYTIPGRTVSRPNVNSRSSRSSFLDIFKSRSFGNSSLGTRSSSSFNDRIRSSFNSSRTSSKSRSVTRSSSSRSSSKSSRVSRSSSSSKSSSGTRSRGSSSSSKRSRGGN